MQMGGITAGHPRWCSLWMMNGVRAALVRSPSCAAGRGFSVDLTQVRPPTALQAVFKFTGVKRADTIAGHTVRIFGDERDLRIEQRVRTQIDMTDQTPILIECRRIAARRPRGERDAIQCAQISRARWTHDGGAAAHSPRLSPTAPCDNPRHPRSVSNRFSVWAPDSRTGRPQLCASGFLRCLR